MGSNDLTFEDCVMPKSISIKTPRPWHDVEVKEDIFNEIVGRLANGESLRQVCADSSKVYPMPDGFLYWVSENPAFTKHYARAMQIRAEMNSELILEYSHRIAQATKIAPYQG